MEAQQMKTSRKQSIKPLALAASILMSGLFVANAYAGVVTYTPPKHIFSINDVKCGSSLSPDDYGTACLSQETILNEKDGEYYYGIDSDFGYNVEDFNWILPQTPRLRDGVYTEGMIHDVLDPVTGETIGVKAVTEVTKRWKAGPLKGEWLAGLGGLSVKGATEHYRVMDNVLNADWMPPLVAAELATPGDPSSEIINVADFGTRMKDDGKILFMWGNLNKKPTDLELFTTIPVPDAWKAPGANFDVLSAKLIVEHRITTSPNDQIRPEDFENESATGILPSYNVLPDGSWVSAVDALAGDGSFIPAGTILKSPALVVSPGETGYYPSSDLVYGLTNAWFTSLDRDPFGGLNPRYRLTSSKYGQDNPGVEIPQYEAGQRYTTTIDLLSILDDEGHSVLAQSANWYDYLDVNPEKGDLIDDDFTIDGCPLSPDFDLMLYIKGEYSGTEVYNAQLVIEYEDPDYTEPPVDQVDDAIYVFNTPNRLKPNATGTFAVQIWNEMDTVSTGMLDIVVTDVNSGAVIDTYSTQYTTTLAGVPIGYTYDFQAPDYKTTLSVTATLTPDGTEVDPGDNTATNTVVIK